mmetsp:Transcript_62774/g.194343  ORF Transcript_62774/g.194343 Transcript_62774/m.194343 type:complete len:143 (-) Transcript_62774:29-457(-)
MGAVADAALRAGAEVRGIVPRSLVAPEMAHKGLTELRVVETMHERKQLMIDLSDMVAALPGGLGTWEELLEAMTWAQLGFHGKPIGLLNTRGYYDPLLAMLERCVTEGFMKREFISYLVVATDPGELVDKLLAYNPQRTSKF